MKTTAITIPFLLFLFGLVRVANADENIVVQRDGMMVQALVGYSAGAAEGSPWMKTAGQLPSGDGQYLSIRIGRTFHEHVILGAMGGNQTGGVSFRLPTVGGFFRVYPTNVLYVQGSAGAAFFSAQKCRSGCESTTKVATAEAIRTELSSSHFLGAFGIGADVRTSGSMAISGEVSLFLTSRNKLSAIETNSQGTEQVSAGSVRFLGVSVSAGISWF